MTSATVAATTPAPEIPATHEPLPVRLTVPPRTRTTVGTFVFTNRQQRGGSDAGIVVRQDDWTYRLTPFAITGIAVYPDDPDRFDLTAIHQRVGTRIEMEWTTTAEAALRLANIDGTAAAGAVDLLEGALGCLTKGIVNLGAAPI
jgi:hypothetical protein